MASVLGALAALCFLGTLTLACLALHRVLALAWIGRRAIAVCGGRMAAEREIALIAQRRMRRGTVVRLADRPRERVVRATTGERA